VRSLTAASPKARILRLDLEGVEFPFLAGQAAMLGTSGQPLRKPYSVACAPEQAASDGYLEFLIGLEASGRIGAHLAGVARGHLVAVEGPFGRFAVPDEAPERRFLFAGGGTGIAPLRAMLHHALARHPATSIAVVYSARTSADLSYDGELRRLARSGRIALTLTVTREPLESAWTGDRGRIGRRLLAPYLTKPETLCFVCGPPAFVAHVAPLLQDMGVAKKRILKEDW
jgi:NAD(P)H-flavin reductase